MLEDHSIVEREGFKVPLIGIAPAAVLQECDLCHEQKPLREITLQDSGQFLCALCASVAK